MRCAVLTAAVAAALVWSAPGGAQQTDTITFTGTVDDTCSVATPSDGALELSSDYTELSSKIAGGSPGTATVTSTDNNNKVDIDAAASFDTAPTGGGTNVTFGAEYDASGATSATNVAAGTQTTLGFGATTVTVDAWAEKTSGIFPAGSYAMDVVVSCIAP